MIDITKYILAYSSLKGKTQDQEKLRQFFNELFSKSYSAICIDVDKTIREFERIDDDMLDTIAYVLGKNVSMCFITGMGRTKSREVLAQIYSNMIKRKVDIKNITCATSNGAIFLETDKEFLDNQEKIVNDISIENYNKIKKEIRELYIHEVLKQKIAIGNEKELIQRSLKCSGDMSLRFVLEEIEVKDKDLMLGTLKEIISKTDLAEELYVFKGKHKDKLIWELSIANKLRAVKFFEDRYGIKDVDVIKLGDQGKKSGNDYDMLNTYAGFSVDEIEPTTSYVLPVIDEQGNIIKGTKATKKIIKDLKYKEER